MQRFVAILLLGLLAGCASFGPEQKARLDATIGQSEAALVHERGLPTRATRTGDRQFLAYDDVQHVVIPGSGPGWGYGGVYPTFGPASYWLGDPPIIVNRVCTTTFETVGGRVVGWSRQGKACA
jgi:hypothetical protein